MNREESRTVPPDLHGQRLDVALAKMGLGLSRSKAKSLIEAGLVAINDEVIKKARRIVKSGDKVSVTIPEREPSEDLAPRPVEFNVLYEDNSIIVVDKPPGITVYPGAGREEETLVHGLLHHFKGLSSGYEPLRPGIVHRLDKDTSGVMVIAKTDQAHATLGELFKERRVKKEYLAICRGHLEDECGRIDHSIGRHPVHRKKMSILTRSPRPAITLWEKLESLYGATLLKVRILTGRTHQIRVHMAAIGHPLLGDRLYGGPSHIQFKGKRLEIPRQMLHAFRLSFPHPTSGKQVQFEAPVPMDMRSLLEQLKL